MIKCIITTNYMMFWKIKASHYVTRLEWYPHDQKNGYVTEVTESRHHHRLFFILFELGVW